MNIGTICRGSGKIFLHVSPSSANCDTLNCTASLQDGTDIPALAYPFWDYLKPKPEANSFVVVLPQTSTPIALTLNSEGAQPEYKETKKVTLSPSSVKWKSRYNYRAHTDNANTIRDFDVNRSPEQANFTMWEIIPDANEDILRGSVKLPTSCTGSISIYSYSDTFAKESNPAVIMGDKTLSSNSPAGYTHREISFSLRMPHTGRAHFIQAYDSDERLIEGFGAIDLGDFERLSKIGSVCLYNADNNPDYPLSFYSKRISPAALIAQQSIPIRDDQPLFSIVVPLYKTPLRFLDEMIASVQQQSYPKWELILVNASQDDRGLTERISLAASQDSRIKAVTLNSNLGITLNTNAGIDAASGDFICFLDHDDLLEPDALFEYAKAIDSDDKIDMLYCDEDKLSPEGEFCHPLHKPIFSIDLLRGLNYICHFLAIRKTIIDQLPPSTEEFDGAQDHNMVLAASELAREIHLVPKVLYHWRISETSTAANSDSKPYATLAGVKAVQTHLQRLNIAATVTQSRRPFSYKVQYSLPAEHPLVSIIIPSKDQVDILDQCLTSILQQTTYDNYEIIIVENNSAEPATFAYYDSIVAKHSNIRVEYWPAEFNFSKLINFGASKACGDYLLLLNNDTKLITPDWLEWLVGTCQRDEVGAVGVRLYYPDDTIQHAGICVTGEVADHLNKNLPKGNYGYFDLSDFTQNLSAVTAACVMVRKSVFDEVNGFTEELAVAFNDVDFCLKLREKNYLIVYTPEVELYHYESISRGYEDNPEKQLRFKGEWAYINSRWREYYVNGDPYINRNFTNVAPLNRYYQL